MVFVLSRGVEQALMPVAMLLRSVPLVAMTPVIVLVFGRGTGGDRGHRRHRRASSPRW